MQNQNLRTSARKTKRKDAHQKDHLYKKRQHTKTAKPKDFALRLAKQKDAHQMIIYTKKTTHQDRKIKISAPRLAKQKDAHQKDHLYQKDNTPRPQNNSLRTSARKTNKKAHIKKNI